MIGRRVTTAVTMTILVLILIGMGWLGIHEATKPLPTADEGVTQRCTKDEISTKRFIRRSEVTVSVYNAGARKGFAGLTLQRLEDKGFRAGALGNAPSDTKVRRAVVLTTKADDPAARLVAITMGRGTKVEVVEETMGPGVDVYVGPRMRLLNQRAPARLKLDKPIVDCVQVD